MRASTAAAMIAATAGMSATFAAPVLRPANPELDAALGSSPGLLSARNAEAINIPSIKLPSVSITKPSIKVDKREAEAINLPSVKLPSVSITKPSIKVDKREAEAINLPSVKLPSVSITKPSIDINRREAEAEAEPIDLSSIKLPSVDIDLPSIEINKREADPQRRGRAGRVGDAFSGIADGVGIVADGITIGDFVNPPQKRQVSADDILDIVNDIMKRQEAY